MFTLNQTPATERSSVWTSWVAFILTWCSRVFNVAAFVCVLLSCRASQNLKKINAEVSVTVWRTTESIWRVKQKPTPRRLPAALFCSQDSISRCKCIQRCVLSPVLRIPSHTPCALDPPDVLRCILIITLMNGCWSWREKPTVLWLL